MIPLEGSALADKARENAAKNLAANAWVAGSLAPDLEHLGEADVITSDDVLRMVREYDPGEPRDSSGKWTSGGGGDIQTAAVKLQSGGSASLPAEQLPGLMARMAASSEPVQLSNLHVEGADHGNLFDHSATDLPREAMPVVPANADGVQKFAEFLGQRGIGARTEDVSPSDLHATQCELDGRKVGQIYGRMQSDIERFGAKYLVVSRDGAVLDGHHRWAAACVHEISNPGYTVPVLRVNTDIHALLDLGNQFTDSQGTTRNKFGGA